MKKRDMIRYTITTAFLFAAAGTAVDDQILLPAILTAASIVVFLKKKGAPAHERKRGTDADFDNISHKHYNTERTVYGSCKIH